MHRRTLRARVAGTAVGGAALAGGLTAVAAPPQAPPAAAPAPRAAVEQGTRLPGEVRLPQTGLIVLERGGDQPARQRPTSGGSPAPR